MLGFQRGQRVDKQRFTEAIRCGHCGNHAPMKTVAEYRQVTTHSHEGAPFDWDEGPFWELSKCPACGGVVLRRGYWHEHLSDETGPDYEVLYPAQRQEIEGLPKEIASAYAAALKVKPIDSNAFGVLLGRVLDLVSIEQKAEGDSLYNRLKDIARKGIIPERLADMAHGLRKLRNIGAHADLGELTPLEIPILESLIKAILEYVYSAQTMVSRVQEKLDALKEKKT